MFYVVPDSRCLITKCIQFSKCLFINGGDEEIRTPDPLLARQVLSQLSYTPTLNNLYKS